MSSIGAGSYKRNDRVSKVMFTLKRRTTDPMSYVHGIPYTEGDHNEVIGTGNINETKKSYEVGVVVVANAVVQPRTMVVHP